MSEVAKQLAVLQREIMLNASTIQDWERLDSEVNEAISCATDDEIQAFVDSGAGEALDMACSAIHESRKNT